MDLPPELASYGLFGVSGIIIVRRLVDVLKLVGMDSKWSGLASILLGILIMLVTVLQQYSSELRIGALIVLGGAILGLTASGDYSQGKAVAAELEKRAAEKTIAEGKTVIEETPLEGGTKLEAAIPDVPNTPPTLPNVNLRPTGTPNFN